MNPIEIAEIRVQVIGQSAPYPTFIRTTHQTLTFSRNVPENPYHHRRYVIGKADPENQIFPIEQARGDMTMLAHSHIEPFKLEWSWLTPEELAEENKRVGLVTEIRSQEMAKDAERRKAAEQEPPAPPASVIEAPPRNRRAAPKIGKGGETPPALKALAQAGV